MQPEDQQPKEVITPPTDDTLVVPDTTSLDAAPVVDQESSEQVSTPEPTPVESPALPAEPDVTPAVETPATDLPTEPLAQAVPSEPAGFTVSQPAPIAQPTAPSKKKLPKKLKILLIAVLAIVVLLGASASAYFGVIVPNKPENVLKAAVANTLKEKQVSFDGVVDTQAADAKKADASPAANITFKGASDADKSALKAEITAVVSGFKVQAEVRYLDQTGYVKLGDLSSVKNLADGYAPGASSLVSKVENQWIEIDKTLIKEAKADCVLNTKLTVNDADLKLLSDAYSKNMFATIKSTSSDTVNGKSATKMVLSLDDNKMADYVKNLDSLSFMKQLKSCNSSVDTSKIDVAKLKDNDMTPLTVWVDKGNKRIVKLATQSTEQDAKKDNFKGSMSVTLSYGAVSIDKPVGAKPIMTLLSEFAPLLNGNDSVLGAKSTNPLSLLGI